MADRTRNERGFGRAISLNVPTPMRAGASRIVRALLWFFRPSRRPGPKLARTIDVLRITATQDFA